MSQLRSAKLNRNILKPSSDPGSPYTCRVLQNNSPNPNQQSVQAPIFKHKDLSPNQRIFGYKEPYLYISFKVVLQLLSSANLKKTNDFNFQTLPSKQASASIPVPALQGNMPGRRPFEKIRGFSSRQKKSTRV